MEKQQKIHSEWSKLGIILLISQYDFDGWADVNELEKEQITNDLEYNIYRENEIGHQAILCRPKLLKGIENNNGWTKIESEKILFEKPENCLFEWYNIFDKRYDVGEHFNYGVFTHFKVIPEPVKELPLY